MLKKFKSPDICTFRTSPSFSLRALTTDTRCDCVRFQPLSMQFLSHRFVLVTLLKICSCSAFLFLVLFLVFPASFKCSLTLPDCTRLCNFVNLICVVISVNLSIYVCVHVVCAVFSIIYKFYKVKSTQIYLLISTLIVYNFYVKQ